MILAADFGGTAIKLGLLHNGKVMARTRLDARAGLPMAERLEAAACAWESMLREKGGAIGECTGAALALPFAVDPRNMRVLGDFEKFPGADGIDFKAWGCTRLGLPVEIENDLRVALLGEWTAGAAQGKRDVVMLAFGTGIGCAAISDNRLLRGGNNRAAILFGHSTIAYQGMAGRCGNPGCAEDLASTATLVTLAKAHPDFASSRLSRAEKIDYESVFALAAEGDRCSQLLLEQSLQAWAAVVQNAVIAFDPELVVLGGGVLRQHGLVLPAIKKHLQQHMPALPSTTPVVQGALGDDAALIGCEALFQKASFPSV